MGRRNKTHKIAAAPPVPPFSEERRHVGIVLVFCVVGFLIYANTLTSTFHFDDWLVIVNNPAIRHPGDLGGIFKAFNTRFIPGVTFAVNAALGGLDVFGYHFFNIWLHVCNAVLLYTLTLQLLSLDEQTKNSAAGAKILIAFAAAAIFLVHPIQTQAVNYIWQRTTVMATFFYLATIVLYIYGRVHTNRAYYRAALACCLAAMLSKEIAFTLPLMILVVEFLWMRRSADDRRSWFWAAPFLLMLLIIPILLQGASASTLKIMHPHDALSGVAEAVMPHKEYWLTQVNAVTTYLRLFLWPAGQSIDHNYPLASVSGWAVSAVSWVIVGAIIVFGFMVRRRYPLAAFCAAWFLVTLSVESIVTSADVLVEHRMYLPMAGLCLGFAIAIHQWIRNRRTTNIMLVVVLTALAVATVSRNTVWQNDLKLWSDAIQKAPNKARAYNNRGIELKKLGFLDAALQDFSRAIDINPQYPEAYYNRGGIYKMEKAWDLAVADYARVIDLEPENFQGFDARGYIYRRQGRWVEALKDFAVSIGLNPRNPEVYNNRAYVYQKMGRNDLAAEDYTKAVEADPAYIYAYNNRGNIYLESGKYDLAVADYTRAISLQADFGEAYVNRAVAYFRLNRLQESATDVERARKLGMKPNPEFLQQLKAASRH